MIEKTWSYWEKEAYWSDYDLAIIGAGITGLSAAIFAKQNNPDQKIVVLEQGFLPEGASTKNAGFACYGSLGELQDDIKIKGYKACIALVKERYQGLRFLRQLVSDAEMDYLDCGGVEIFNEDQTEEWLACKKLIPQLNKDLREFFGGEVFYESDDYKSFKNCIGSIRSPYEGSLNPAKMMQALFKKAVGLGINVFYNCCVEEFYRIEKYIHLKCAQLPNLKAKKLILCTNAFSNRFGDFDLQAVRNMVLISKEFDWPFPEAVYHAHMGYYYFRRIGNRLLIGGARNVDLQAETTDQFGINPKVKTALLNFTEQYLGLDTTDLFMDNWSGILGVGSNKEPIIKEIEEGVYTALRLGGMGVAIGARTGHRVIEVIESS